jgi:hypothetical protein
MLTGITNLMLACFKLSSGSPTSVSCAMRVVQGLPGLPWKHERLMHIWWQHCPHCLAVCCALGLASCHSQCRTLVYQQAEAADLPCGYVHSVGNRPPFSEGLAAVWDLPHVDVQWTEIYTVSIRHAKELMLGNRQIAVYGIVNVSPEGGAHCCVCWISTSQLEGNHSLWRGKGQLARSWKMCFGILKERFLLISFCIVWQLQ